MVRRSDDVERRVGQSMSLWPDGRRRSPGHDGRKTPRGRRSELGQRLLSLNSDRSELKSESRLWSLRENEILDKKTSESTVSPFRGWESAQTFIR